MSCGSLHHVAWPRRNCLCLQAGQPRATRFPPVAMAGRHGHSKHAQAAALSSLSASSISGHRRSGVRDFVKRSLAFARNETDQRGNRLRRFSKAGHKWLVRRQEKTISGVFSRGLCVILLLSCGCRKAVSRKAAVGHCRLSRFSGTERVVCFFCKPRSRA